MNKSLPLALALLAAGSAFAQGMKLPAASSRLDAPVAAQSSMPLVDAVVKKVDPARRMIVLKHGDIPNLGMPAMTMGFDVADPKMLKAVKAGDKVRFQADMVAGKATVTDLRRAD